DQQTQCNEIQDNRRRNQPVTKPNTGQAFSGAVIFSDGLQRYAPPKVAVDLNVPLIPTAIRGIPPALLFEQLEHFAQEIVAVPTLLGPDKAAPQLACEGRARRRLPVPPHGVGRCACGRPPGDVSSTSSSPRTHRLRDTRMLAR